MTLRIGVIPSNGRECSALAVEALLPQVDYLAVVEAGYEITPRDYPDKVTILADHSKADINISRWWNIGLNWAQAVATALEEETWDVAIINDDVEVPPTWLCYIADDMRVLGCVAACSGGTSSTPIIHRAVAPVMNLYQRLQGFAFVVAGESGIRADERFRWYWGDDDLSYVACQLGGVVMFPDCHVVHRHPNAQVTPAMQVMIAEDGEKFKAKWGSMPW